MADKPQDAGSGVPLHIDEAKLASESGSLYALQFLAQMSKDLLTIDESALKAEQPALTATLLKLVTHADPAWPVAGRSLRNLAAKCLAALYRRGETRSLFDDMHALLRVVGDLKASGEARLPAWYCIGEVMLEFGSEVMSQFSEVVVQGIKTLKASSQSVIIRSQAVVAVSKSLTSAGRALSDHLAKDLLKQLRNGLSDKALPVQRACADCLLSLASHTPYLSTLPDIESLLALCIKALDGADQPTRRALSSLMAHLLASSQVEGSAASAADAPRPSGAGDDDPYPSTSTAARDEGAKTLLSPSAMLQQLSVPFNRPQTTRKTRNALIDVYATLLSLLGTAYVEAHYGTIVAQLLNEVASSPRSTSTRHEALAMRELVGVLLRDLIGVRLLSEQGQITAISELGSAYLAKWPALLPGQTEPHKQALIIALGEVAGLLQQLGNAPQPVQDVLYEPLVRLLAHPSFSVQIAAARALRDLCCSTPSRLPTTLTHTLDLLSSNLTNLATPGAPADLAHRALGHAHALAALLNAVPSRQLYVSLAVSTRIFDLAIFLLKSAGEHDLPVASVEIQVAWTLVGALMSLGPHFVRLHLPQLLVLWRNALPKPTTPHVARADAEWAFLMHVRECALTAVLAFLRHNASQLVTLDVSRRLLALLNHSLAFTNAFAASHAELIQEQMPSGSAAPGRLTLLDRDVMLRRRVFQCYTALGQAPATEALQAGLVQAALAVFADPERYTGSAAQAAIAASAGTFKSIWDVWDGYSYGVTSLQERAATRIAESEEDKRARTDWLNRDRIELQIDSQLRRPVIGATEHDVLSLYARAPTQSDANAVCAEPPPPATGLVDAALELFALVLPTQDADAQTLTLERLSACVRTGKLERNPGRKSAILVNAVVALLGALRHTSVAARRARESIASARVSALISSLLKDAILSDDPSLRFAGSEALGRLASIADTPFMTAQVQFLVDQVVSNRDPDARAGCVLAFGAIYSRVGGLAAGPLLKTIVNILMSLSADPHPVVHYYALDALATVIDAANLGYAPYLHSTLGMLAKLYSLESHEPEGGSLASANVRGDLPAYQAACKIIDAAIGVLGPELRDESKVRALVLTLVEQFSDEADEGIAVEAIKCLHHFVMFAPEHADIPALIQNFRSHLSSTRRPLKIAAINGFYQLVQRNVALMSKLGGDRLVEDLFGLLDDDPSIDGVRHAILSWLKQTAELNPSGWIDLCQRIMARTTASQQAVQTGPAAGGIRDEEVEGLGVEYTGGGGVALGGSGKAARLTSRWRTQLFALQCLHQVFLCVVAGGRREHFDLSLARASRANPRALLISRVADLIKMAFTASTAQITEIRLEGLVLLRDVIENFARSPDPDFEDALLLEQHQAPIAAALTPAFAADSTPEILAAAIQVSAVFVGSGVIKEVPKMGRILKLLTNALEQCKASDMSSLGEVKNLSGNAVTMLKISTFTAWAELATAAATQPYLDKVLEPYLPTLAPVWVDLLREYARTRTDPEASSALPGAADLSYAGLAREVILPYYERSWIAMLHALAATFQTSHPLALQAMGADEEPKPALANGTAARQHPAPLFWAVYGLTYEVLAADDRTELRASVALLALNGLLQSDCAGSAILEDGVFAEFCSLAHRLGVADSFRVQKLVVGVIAGFVKSYGAQLAELSVTNGSAKASLPVDAKLTQCLRIIAVMLRQAIPSRDASTSRRDRPEDRAALVKAAFAAYCDIANVFAADLRPDLFAVGLQIYADILKDETPGLDLPGQTLACLKLVLENAVAAQRDADGVLGKTIHGFLSAALQNMDDMRTRAGPVATAKIKGNLLAAVLVITSFPPSIKLSRAVLEHCSYVITQKLDAEPEVAMVAAQCAKTLIAASGRGNPTLLFCVSQLIPGLVRFLASTARSVKQPEKTNFRANVAEEALKALLNLFTISSEQQRPILLGILLPTFILFLSPEASSPSPLHAIAVTLLLQLATQAPGPFREATTALAEDQRIILETSIRQAVTGGRPGAPAPPTRQSSAPAISLKSFG